MNVQFLCADCCLLWYNGCDSVAHCTANTGTLNCLWCWCNAQYHRAKRVKKARRRRGSWTMLVESNKIHRIWGLKLRKEPKNPLTLGFNSISNHPTVLIWNTWPVSPNKRRENTYFDQPISNRQWKLPLHDCVNFQKFFHITTKFFGSVEWFMNILLRSDHCRLRYMGCDALATHCRPLLILSP